MSHLHHKVSALIDGELSPNARGRALAHARSCAQCRQEIAETLEVKRRVNAMAPVEVSTDLLDVVRSITLAPAVSTPGQRPLMRRAFAGVGSLSVVMIALAYVVGAPQSSQAKIVRPPVEEFAAEFADSTGLAPLSDPAVEGLGADPAARTTQVTFPARTTTAARPSLVDGSAGDTWPVPSTWQAGDEPSAVGELRRALAAPQRLGYVGVLVIRSVSDGGTASFRIEVQHVPGQGTRFDVLRQNGKVRGESFIKEPRVGSGDATGKSLNALAAAYDLHAEGRQEIGGRTATVVSASQHGQVTARFWIDVRTGLLLQRVLYADGQLVRWSGYSSIDVNRHGFMPHLPPELAAPQTTVLSKTAAPALNDLGWTCPQSLTPRFQLSLLHQVHTGGGVMRAEYTDGLSNISVFEERGSLDTSALDDFHGVLVAGNLVYLKAGLPMLAVWESGGTVFTVVTDAPRAMADALIARLPHVASQEQSGVVTRIGHGLSRLVSTVSP